MLLELFKTTHTHGQKMAQVFHYLIHIIRMKPPSKETAGSQMQESVLSLKWELEFLIQDGIRHPFSRETTSL